MSFSKPSKSNSITLFNVYALPYSPSSSSSLQRRVHFQQANFGSLSPVSSFQMSSISKPISQFLRKSFLFWDFNITSLAAIHNTNSINSLRHFSVDLDSDNKQSFTVSYFINSLGFSPKSALSSSKYMKFDSSDKPDKNIEFLKGYGFTQTQISNLVRRNPRTLLYSADEIVLPKLEFFESKGLSRPELIKALSLFPTVLSCTLENQIIPTYEFLKDFLKSDQMAVTVFRRFPDLFCHKIEKRLAPNIAILKDHGVRYSDIASLIRGQPRVISIPPDSFRKIVKEVAEMGFDPLKYSFITAVSVLRMNNKSTWEGKANVYKKWGWSDEEIKEAFKRYPQCMTISEENIMESMDVFVNKVGVSPCVLAKRPKYLVYSLKRRVIPRMSVLEALMSKGLIKEMTVYKLTELTDNKFFKMFVEAYSEEAPELMKLYKKNMDVSSSTGMDNERKLNSSKEKRNQKEQS